ncbi:hypothetical protein EGR_04899 [Echinococcus granulosus]|uniref:Uncharacterized protein n=1 Tax=Echinococcus granulosus TaxID=6210 RepID=W6V2L9_ECHGR|nr:hypothetical protein EGR_04899 [Echinococcus granulosus]EUB60189.1 hypothetical protein EGR_04899 [Echinococcus granulosus]
MPLSTSAVSWYINEFVKTGVKLIEVTAQPTSGHPSTTKKAANVTTGQLKLDGLEPNTVYEVILKATGDGTPILHYTSYMKTWPTGVNIFGVELDALLHCTCLTIKRIFKMELQAYAVSSQHTHPKFLTTMQMRLRNGTFTMGLLLRSLVKDLVKRKYEAIRMMNCKVFCSDINFRNADFHRFIAVEPRRDYLVIFLLYFRAVSALKRNWSLPVLLIILSMVLWVTFSIQRICLHAYDSAVKLYLSRQYTEQAYYVQEAERLLNVLYAQMTEDGVAADNTAVICKSSKCL